MRKFSIRVSKREHEPRRSAYACGGGGGLCGLCTIAPKQCDVGRSVRRESEASGKSSTSGLSPLS